MKIVFMGTPDFAVSSLKALIKEFDVRAVLTQPDKRKGRGKKIAFSPVKEAALEHGIEVYQPVRLRKDRETIERLKEIAPDFIIVVAFGQILSKEVLDIPKYGCINLHASLLPQYRGAAPINWAVVNGEKESGNTTMLMNEGLDTGDMLLKDKVEITDEMTFGELHDILMNSGGELLVKTIKGIVNNKIKPEKQDDEKSCYASMLQKKMGEIDWSKSGDSVHNLIRGFNPWPTAYTYFDEKVMKIHKSKVIDEKTNKEPGTILEVNEEGIKVACGDGMLLLEVIQFPGKKPLKVSDYIKGNKIEIGKVLG
jgi:methionyl-tRNA formyltransferase